MHAHIVLRKIAAAAAQLIHLRQRLRRIRLGFGSHRDPAADAAAVRFHAGQFDLDPVTVQCGVTAEKLRNRVDAVHGHVDIAVVVVVAESAPARRRVLQNPRAAFVTDIFKPPVL